MNPLDKFEHFFERVMEESVGRIFRSPVQPAEIGRRLERAMESNQVVSVDGIIVPNDYNVEMNPQDMVIFAEFVPALCRQMEEWLTDLAKNRSYEFIDHVRVQIVGAEGVSRRQIFVEAEIRELPNFNQHEQDQIQKTEVMRVVRDTGDIPPKLLRFVGGHETGSTIIVRRPLVAIGRALDNDIVLESAEVSRHHARIDYRGSAFFIVDLGSTNGTLLNGERTVESELQHGDRITLGDITLEFLPYTPTSSEIPGAIR
jgi:hypothetical protein